MTAGWTACVSLPPKAPHLGRHGLHLRGVPHAAEDGPRARFAGINNGDLRFETAMLLPAEVERAFDQVN